MRRFRALLEAAYAIGDAERLRKLAQAGDPEAIRQLRRGELRRGGSTFRLAMQAVEQRGAAGMRKAAGKYPLRVRVDLPTDDGDAGAIGFDIDGIPDASGEYYAVPGHLQITFDASKGEVLATGRPVPTHSSDEYVPRGLDKFSKTIKFAWRASFHGISNTLRKSGNLDALAIEAASHEDVVKALSSLFNALATFVSHTVRILKKTEDEREEGRGGIGRKLAPGVRIR